MTTNRSVRFALAMFAACVLAAAPSVLNADTVTLSTSDSRFDAGVDNQGWWSATEPNVDSADGYFAGNTFGTQFRNFFTFDVASVTDQIDAATLEIARYQYGSSDATEVFELFDVATDAATLNNNNGTSAAIYNDLGSGTSYGSFVVNFYPVSSLQTLSFTLNADGIAALNAARGGFFSIGGTVTSTSFIDMLFVGSSGIGTQQLVLTTSPEPPVIPLPAAVWAGLALMGTITAKRVRDRARASRP